MTSFARSTTDSQPPELTRALGPRDVLLYFITAGTNLQWVAVAAAAGPSSIVVWVLGGLAMFLPLAVCVVYLSAHHPDHGGLYVWSKRAFGPFAGFLTGWLFWTSNLPYFPGLLYFAAGNALFLTSSDAARELAQTPAYFVIFALLGLALATVLNVTGLGLAKQLSNAGAYARSALIVLITAIALVVYVNHGSATQITPTTLLPGFGLEQLLFWSTIAFAWTGAESASFMGGEIRDPRRTVPRALAAAAPIIAAIYIVGTLSVLVTVPSGESDSLYGIMQAVTEGAERLGLTGVVPVAALLVTIACLGSVGAWLGSVARIPFVAGVDRFLPPSFAHLHPRWRTPVTALVLQATIAALFVFLGQAGTTVKGAYEVLISMMVIAVLMPFLFLFSAAIKLSATPTPGVQVRIPGGRTTVVLMAVVGLATTAGSIILAAIPRPDEANKLLAITKIVGSTSLMLAIGVAIYAVGTHRARRRERA
ncbi:MAG: APC family permease [Steroidobacteraceae bacterium]|nr:APC family permease [Steroidobacteraceae bacterium]